MLLVNVLLIFWAFFASPFDYVSCDTSALIGPKECSTGPTYWCSNLINAVTCNAVTHCTQTIWETTVSRKQDECSICVRTLDNIRAAIEDKSPRYIVWQLLNDMCTVGLKQSSLAATSCNQLVQNLYEEKNYAEFTKLILNKKIHDDLICSVSGFCFESDKSRTAVKDYSKCNSIEDVCADFSTASDCNKINSCLENAWENQNVKPQSTAGECTECVTLIKPIQKLIKENATSNEVRRALEYICTLPVVSENYYTCLTWVDKYADDLVYVLRSKLTPFTICALLGFCLVTEDKIHIKFDNIELIAPDFFRENDYKGIEISQPKPLVGQEMCTWGPGSWCKNLTLAAQCHATPYCIKSVWEKQEFEEDNDDVCQICKNMVIQAREQLQSNETQEELKEVLEGSCKLIHLSPIVKNCIQVVDDFIPELTDMLLSMLNPTAVCSVAGLCNNVVIDKMLLENQDKPVEYKGHKMCENCNKFITYVQHLFRTASKENVYRKFVQICGEFSSYSDICTSSITNNFNFIYDRLVVDFEPYKVCHLTGMCAYKFHFHPKSEQDKDTAVGFNEDIAYSEVLNEIKENNDLPCDLCVQLADHVKQELISNTTEEEFHEILVGICGQTGKFKQECLNFVENNFEILYKYLLQEFNATELCQDIGICKRTGNFITDNKGDIISGRLYFKGSQDPMKMLSALLGQGITATESNIGSTSPPISTTTVSPYPACTLCTYTLHYIQEILHNPTEEHKIEDAVGKVCTYFPKGLYSECDGFIKQYGPLIIAMFAQEVDPSLVCPALKVCPSTEEVTPKMAPSVQSSCPICLLAMDEILNKIKNNKTEAHIEEVLSQICNHFKDKAECENLINTYYHDIVDMVIADFTPKEICAFLKLCSQQSSHDSSQYSITTTTESDEINSVNTGKNTESNIDKMAVKSQVTKKCLLCETLIKNFEHELESNITKTALEDLFSGFCEHIKGALKDECKVLVYKYTDRIYEMLVNKVNVTDICATIKFCPYNKEYDEVKSRCQFCEAVIGSLNGILADPYLDYEIVEYVDKVCDMFPKTQTALCGQIMNQVIPTLESVAHQIPPWFICTKIKFCPYNVNSPLTTGTVGGSPCTWGPAYWCQSKTTAAMCQTTEHCQTYVWKGIDPKEK